MNKILKRPKIGIDMHGLGANPTGIGKYIANLSAELIKHSEFDWFLYHPNPVFDMEFYHGSTTTHRFGQNASQRTIVWNQLCLANLVKADELDLFFSPNHRLPLNLPKKVKKVVTVHDLTAFLFPETMRWRSKIIDQVTLKNSIKMANRIITVSQNTKIQLTNYANVQPQTVDVTHLASTLNFTNLSDLKPSASSLNHRYVLFVGTIEPRKNLGFLVTAFCALRSLSGFEDLSLKIVGKRGWGRIDLPFLDNMQDQDNKITWIDYCEDKQLSDLYRNASFLALPSHYEGFGLPIVEALSFGVPVLVPNRSAMAEVADNNKFIYEADEIESFVEKATHLLDRRNSSKIKNDAIKRSRDFSWSKTAEATCTSFLLSLAKE